MKRITAVLHALFILVFFAFVYAAEHIDHLRRLQSTITDAGIPAVGTKGGPAPASVTVDYAPEATPQQITDGNNIAASFDWSESAHDLWLAQRGSKVVGIVVGKRKSANQSNNTTTLVDVADLTYNMAANSHYIVKCYGDYTAAATTTGLALALNGPAGTNFARFQVMAFNAVTSIVGAVVTAPATPLIGATSGGATPLPFWIIGTMSTGANAGVFALQFASEVGGSAVTINRGALCEFSAAQ